MYRFPTDTKLPIAPNAPPAIAPPTNASAIISLPFHTELTALATPSPSASSVIALVFAPLRKKSNVSSLDLLSVTSINFLVPLDATIGIAIASKVSIPDSIAL